MKIIKLRKEAKNKIARLKEISIFPVKAQQETQPHLQRNITQPQTPRCRAVWMNVRLTALRAMLVIGVITTLAGLCMYFFSPQAELRGAKIKQLQQDLRAGKIDVKQYNQGYEEAIRK